MTIEIESRLTYPLITPKALKATKQRKKRKDRRQTIIKTKAGN